MTSHIYGLNTIAVMVFWAFQDILTFLDCRECTAFQDIFVILKNL